MHYKTKLIFFDFDGVIADSFEAAFEANKILYPSLEREVYRRRFDGNINETMGSDRLGESYKPDTDFFKEYDSRLLKSPMFPGMREVLEILQAQFTLVIISSTTASLINKFLALHKIDKFFREILGNDTHASKIKKLEIALARYDSEARDCIFVTDTLGDIKEAHHMRIKTIAVTWGYQPKELLEKGTPFATADTPQDLLRLLISPYALA